MAASPPLHYRFGDGDIPENPPPAPPHFRIIEIVAAFLGNINRGPFLATHTQACLIIGLRRVPQACLWPPRHRSLSTLRQPHFRIVEIIAAFLRNIPFDTQACLIIFFRRLRVVEDTDEDEDEDEPDEDQDEDDV